GVIVPFLLIAVMVFLANRWFWTGRQRPERHKIGKLQTASMIGAIAGYDGILGPGAGTFFLSYFEKIGFKTVEANAMTKVFNLSSNLGALIYFASTSHVIW